jgi:hypothetical protein
MGVATGHSPQSVRFTTLGVPKGHYDLSVVANGISSHNVNFYQEVMPQAEIIELRRELKSLQRSVQSFASTIKVEEPICEPKRSHKDEEDEKSEKK